MHRLRKLCLFAAVVGVGCSADDSDTTIVTTAITSTNGNLTVGSATLPDEGGSMTGLGGGTSDGGGGTSSGGLGGDESSTTTVDTNGDMGSTGETSSGSDTGNSDGDEMCDPSLLLAMTPGCVEGYKIESAAWADSYCVDNFGDGWIWLEHHQQGGWFVQGTWIDDNGIGERGWVYVNDQTSACYETDYGVTWVRAAFPDWQCRADCWSTIGLEGPEYHPQDGQKCNSYEGDTPCDHCRPLICARP
jgi:hypothetical protein